MCYIKKVSVLKEERLVYSYFWNMKACVAKMENRNEAYYTIEPPHTYRKGGEMGVTEQWLLS